MSENTETVKSEESSIFGRCRCCLEYGYMKNMWVEQRSTGEREVYGEMLMDTFSIAWESTSGKAYICEPCIVRLRDASNFKKELLFASEQMLQEDSDEYEMEENGQEDWSNYELEEEAPYTETEYTEEGSVQETIKSEDEYEQVEYLEEYLEDEVEEGDNKPISQPPEKQKTKRTPRGYKQYSSNDMKGAMEAVLNANFSIAEAAKTYNVPRKTLTAKLHNLKTGKHDSVQSAVKQEVQDKQYFFVEEVKKILSFTTAVPFKTKASRYYCALCYISIDSFDHPSELRSHTRIHDDEMVYEMDRILRPQFQNEILRVDIRDFQCKVCAQHIESWNDMFIHLSEVHQIELDEVYNRLIPYNLTSNSKVNCALCGAEFPNFQYLDAHMNAHYCNYMCSECGDTFVTEIRLKHHEMIHNTGKYPCKHCGKVFSLEKYKKKHEAMVHGEYKMFRCIDCGEHFLKEYERHLHIVEQHPSRVRISTCEVCGKNFDWRPYYLAHLRKAHSKVKKNICRYCGKRFVTKHEVKTHEMRHTGDGRFLCMFCGKNFVTSIELTKHSARHIKEAESLKAVMSYQQQSKVNVVVERVDNEG